MRCCPSSAILGVVLGGCGVAQGLAVAIGQDPAGSHLELLQVGDDDDPKEVLKRLLAKAGSGRGGAGLARALQASRAAEDAAAAKRGAPRGEEAEATRKSAREEQKDEEFRRALRDYEFKEQMGSYGEAVESSEAGAGEAEAERKKLREAIRADEEAVMKDALQQFDAVVKAQAGQKAAGSSAAAATPTPTSGTNATEERRGGDAAAVAGGADDAAAGRTANATAAARGDGAASAAAAVPAGGANATAGARVDGTISATAAVPAGGANATAAAVAAPAGAAEPEAAASRCGEWPSQPVFGCDRRNRNWVQLGNYTGDAACRALCGLRAGHEGELCCYVSASAGCWVKPGSRAFRYGRAGGLSVTCS